jgi:ornithine cyclodeaminase/alanine dehydrogenase-like protein (mu-crystallin family)
MPAVLDVLIITRRDVQAAMSASNWLEAAEQAFRGAATGKANSPQPLHLAVPRGGFHAKGASIELEREYVAVKVNGNFPDNPAELGLPTVQGAIILADGNNGTLLAIIDSIEVTLRRTAAASALAAKLLARPESATLLICGCGEQGRAHAEALQQVLPLERLLLWDRNGEAAEVLATTLGGAAIQDPKAASLSADVIACCSPAREPYLDADMVSPGTFIAAVGADNPDKSEITPSLMARATVITDALHQCAAFGDLRHAIDAGLMTESDVHAELAEIVSGTKAARRLSEDVIIFDSTGTGLLDVAASAAIYERCIANGIGTSITLGMA